MDKCFHQFGTISDATPIGAKAKDVKVLIVTQDYDIIELFVLVNTFTSKLNGETIANKLLTLFTNVCSLDPKYWRPATMYFAGTNKKSLNFV